MRVVLFFDLPTETAAQRKSYRQFRKYLLKEGYLMVQESVYSKLVVNENSYDAAINKLKKNKPSQGLVQVLKVTEKQYATMLTISGDANETEALDTTENLVVL